MKASTLRAIEAAFGPRDEEKLLHLAEMMGKTPAAFLVESVRRIYANVTDKPVRPEEKLIAEAIHE